MASPKLGTFYRLVTGEVYLGLKKGVMAEELLLMVEKQDIEKYTPFDTSSASHAVSNSICASRTSLCHWGRDGGCRSPGARRSFSPARMA